MSFEMYPILILYLSIIYLNSVQCKSLAKFCTETKNLYEVNRLQSIFTIGDKVYIRAGTDYSVLWIFDTNKNEVLTESVNASDMFRGFHPIVEHVAVVECDNCGEKVNNLAIVIGRKNQTSDHWYATFRMQSDNTFTKITAIEDLPDPIIWELKPEVLFNVNDVYFGFFPESVISDQYTSSDFHAFTYYKPRRMFVLKYYNKRQRFFFYRTINSDGSLTPWKDIALTGTFYTLNSLFPMRDLLYSIDNDPQYMPLIASEIKVGEVNGVIDFKTVDLKIEAREFFNCFDKPTPTISTTPTTLSSSQSLVSSTPQLVTSAETLQTDSPSLSVQTSEELTTELTQTTGDNRNITEMENKVEPTDEPEDGINWLWFLLAFALLLIILFSIIIIMYFSLRKKKDRNQNDFNSVDGNRDSNTMEGSPSSTSMRSIKDRNKANVNNMDGSPSSPSRTSMRSIRDRNKANVNNMDGSPSSPSKTSMRSIRDRNKANVNDMDGSPSSPSKTSMRSIRDKNRINHSQAVGEDESPVEGSKTSPKGIKLY